MDDRVTVAQQVADLAELRAARQRRQESRRGTPEWDDAVADEERLVARISNWVVPRGRPPPAEG